MKTTYSLDSDNLDERRATYWAINALRDIEFAATQQNEQVIKRLQKDLKQKLF